MLPEGGIDIDDSGSLRFVSAKENYSAANLNTGLQRYVRYVD